MGPPVPSAGGARAGTRKRGALLLLVRVLLSRLPCVCALSSPLKTSGSGVRMNSTWI